MKIYFTPLALASVLVLACNGKDPETTETDSGTSAATTTSDSASSTAGTTTSDVTATMGTTATTTTATTTTASGTESDSATTGCSFLDCQDGGGEMMNECDPFAQDCPVGQKCLPWANDGGGSWNATKCSDVGPEPGIDGDPCTVEGSAVSGIDSCEVGFICWFVVGETNEGTCIPQCKGTPDNPECPSGKTCDISNGGVINICLDECDPVTVNCPEGQICFPSSAGTFICDFDASGPDMGAYGDPCEFINVCDPGLFCADAASVPGCNAGGCCSEFCDINEPNTCSGMGDGQECIPWYNEGEAPPGYDHVGGCSLPPP